MPVRGPWRSARLAGDEGVQDGPRGCPSPVLGQAAARGMSWESTLLRAHDSNAGEVGGDGETEVFSEARDEHHWERGKGGIEPDDAGERVAARRDAARKGRISRDDDARPSGTSPSQGSDGVERGTYGAEVLLPHGDGGGSRRGTAGTGHSPRNV